MLLHNARPGTEPIDAEDGYLLLTVLVMIFLILLALSVAAPKVAKEIQRDKEQEAMQRGLQYRRAIQLYYKKFGAYPTDVKQLEKTNEIRFLRKRYTDPITGKDDWRLIHMGEAKVPPLGFFGQPLQAGMSSVSTGPGGSGGSIYAPTNTDDTNGANGSSGGSANGAANGTGAPASGASSSFGFSNSGSGNGSSGGFGSQGSGMGSSSNSGFGSSNNGFGSPNNGNAGTTPGGPNGPGGNNNNSGSAFGSAGPIVGVGIPVKKNSMLEYHKQKKYSDWEFVYDPQTDMMLAGGITNGGNINGAGANNNSTGTGVNGTNGSNGSSGTNGSSGGFGNFGSSGSGGNSGSGFGSFGNSGSGSGSGSSGNPAPTMPNSPQQ
jgi:type II secretory pathway pseudopilin PulG